MNIDLRLLFVLCENFTGNFQFQRCSLSFCNMGNFLHHQLNGSNDTLFTL